MTDHENFNPSEFDSLEFSNHTEAKKAEALFNRLSSQNARLVEALTQIAEETSGAIQRARYRKSGDSSLLDLHATVIDTQIKAREAIERARAALAEIAREEQS